MAKYTDEELRDFVNRFSVTGGGAHSRGTTGMGGRASYKQPIDDSSSFEVGASGHYVKGKRFKDAAVDRADLEYKKRFKNDSELRARLGANLNESAGKRGIDAIGVDYTIPFKKGGKVTRKAKLTKASNRGDGCAKTGKTKGRFV